MNSHLRYKNDHSTHQLDLFVSSVWNHSQHVFLETDNSSRTAFHRMFLLRVFHLIHFSHIHSLLVKKCRPILIHPSIEIIKETIDSLSLLTLSPKTPIILAHDYGKSVSKNILKR